ncbi:uncharacterized protein [Nicotiana sylvestris]|uniref:uncharacterized protein n=1 Tax=Nicotiana sylvestris TaxID=4096 RepID=UPI00388C94F6
MEAANKNINKILRKMVENHKQWHGNLPFALLGYRTTVRTSTGATPYLLFYGTEGVILIEGEIPSFRIIQQAELSDAEWIKSRYDQLAFIDGKRMNAVCHMRAFFWVIEALGNFDTLKIWVICAMGESFTTDYWVPVKVSLGAAMV